MDFNTILSEVLKEKGMRQRDLAAAVGVTDVTVSNWTRGTVSPSVAQVERIADALDMPACALLAPAELRELICEVYDQDNTIWALLALLALVREDDTVISVIEDLTDMLEKLRE